MDIPLVFSWSGVFHWRKVKSSASIPQCAKALTSAGTVRDGPPKRMSKAGNVNMIVINGGTFYLPLLLPYPRQNAALASVASVEVL
jgi:hypothetical protein